MNDAIKLRDGITRGQVINMLAGLFDRAVWIRDDMNLSHDESIPTEERAAWLRQANEQIRELELDIDELLYIAQATERRNTLSTYKDPDIDSKPLRITRYESK